jgi:hypothetical protein
LTEQEYIDWCKRLDRCAPAGNKVCWPTRVLAEAALPWLVERCQREGLDAPNPGVYQDPHGRCRMFHLTRDLRTGIGRMARQRQNQPDTYREKRRRQRRARRQRDREQRQRDE